MLNNKDRVKTKRELARMLVHNYTGTIADNLVEINWVLVMVWYPIRSYAEKSLVLFGMADAVWVVLSCIYYSTATAFNILLPKYMVGRDSEDASKHLKNSIYLIYGLLTPLILLSIVFNRTILLSLGASSGDLPMFEPYMLMCYFAIWLVCPSAVLITRYYRAIFKTRIAMILDHATTWTMLFGTILALYVFNWGVLGMMVANIIANAVVLMYFIYRLPKDFPNFFKRGFEFDRKYIVKLFNLFKWEALRRLSPRIADLFAVSTILRISPVYLMAKYLYSQINAFLGGTVEASAGLAITDYSHNYGLGLSKKDSYQNGKFLWWASTLALALITIFIYITSPLWIKIFNPSDELSAVMLDYRLYILFFIEIAMKVRYYILLAITRVLYKKYNGFIQTVYALSTIILTPALIYIFVVKLNMGLIGVYTTGVIFSTISWAVSEWYLRSKDIKL